MTPWEQFNVAMVDAAFHHLRQSVWTDAIASHQGRFDDGHAKELVNRGRHTNIRLLENTVIGFLRFREAKVEYVILENVFCRLEHLHDRILQHLLGALHRMIRRERKD